MQQYEMKIYLDSLRAGHAYLELRGADDEGGEVYGYYPAKFDEKKEVLFGEGQLRADRERLESSKADTDIEQTAKSIPLTATEYARARSFIDEQREQPPYYFLVGYNCIDFIQDVVAAAKGADGGSFLELYDAEELDNLSWVGTYANLKRKTIPK